MGVTSKSFGVVLGGRDLFYYTIVNLPGFFLFPRETTRSSIYFSEEEEEEEGEEEDSFTKIHGHREMKHFETQTILK